MDRELLARAYDRSAEGYDERFRPLQREKYRAAAALLEPIPLPAGDLLDAGAGTALFAEWLADTGEPFAPLRESLRCRRFVALDTSLGMLRSARARVSSCVVADLARPPFRHGAFGLVLAVTSILGDPGAGLSSLASLLRSDGMLVATFLAAEARGAERAARAAGLRVITDAAAGQDRAFLIKKNPA